MQIEEGTSENLMTLVKGYLADKNFDNYPNLDLIITGNETIGDMHGNSMSSFSLWTKIQDKLDIDDELIEENPLIWVQFVGTRLRLMDWRF